MHLLNVASAVLGSKSVVLTITIVYHHIRSIGALHVYKSSVNYLAQHETKDIISRYV